MPTNDFLPFANGGGANVLSQADYLALSAIRSGGFTAGTAISPQLNKVWRQSTIMAAVLAQFISDESGQDSLDDGTTATLLANLKAGVKTFGVPAGTVIHVAMNTAPAGYIKANGATVSRTTYAALFAAIGTTFGAGDGSTTFSVPDLRGEFMRGWDDGRHLDPDYGTRTFGSNQADAFKSHNHNILFSANGAGGGTGPLMEGGSTSSTVISDTGGTETRPVNVALLACIKT